MNTGKLVSQSQHPGPPEEPCYAMWLIRPFLDVLADEPELGAALGPELGATLGRLQPRDLDEHVAIRFVHGLLNAAVEQTGDQDLGLKAARRLRLGDAGVIDYLVSSVDTVRQALEVTTRYMRLVNDALHVEITADGVRATVRLNNSVAMPRAAECFELGGLYRTHLRAWTIEAPSDVQVWFTHARPEHTSEYALTFGSAVVCFGAPFSGFTFPERLLDAKLEKADPRLHEVLRKQAERAILELPKAESLTARVRDLISQELGSGDPTAPRIAKRLGMSTSTLTRRLEAEGTSFRDVVDDLRKRLAIEYVGNRTLDLAEVALLVGFSQSPAFYRAFRRWTGQTPLEYRRERRW